MDPYKLLDLPKNFTLEQLKTNYKRVALKTHPDKSGCSDYLFKLVTQAYKLLVKEYEKRQTEKPHSSLRNESKSYMHNQASTSRQPTNESLHVGSGQSFNVNTFNKVFDTYKLDDPVETKGYGTWMCQSSPLREDIAIPNKFKGDGKIDADKFNRVFETQETTPGRKVVIFKEPEALMSCKKMSFGCELGVTKMSDFSGDNMNRKSLHYTDYKVAHTTNRLVDKNTRARKEYTSIDELEAERTTMRTQMSEKEFKAYQKKLLYEELAEKKRQEAVRKGDQAISKHYEKINKLLLGS